jgi:FkbM family methyltransferase
LRDFVIGSGLHLLDIGGRGGPVNELKGLERVAKLTIVEPDHIEAKILLDNTELYKSWLELKIIEEAISKKSGQIELNITRQAGLSSIYPINQEVVHKYFSGDMWTVDKSIIVRSDTLKNIEQRHSLTAVDVIKIDTQGSELEILKSASEKLIEGVSAIMIEIEMQQFYINQPVFSDVDSWLREKGFIIYDMARSKLRRSNSLNLPFSKRELVWAHCLYFKEPSSSRDLSKLASTLICFGYLDSALQVLDLVDSMNPIKDYILLKKDLHSYSKSLLDAKGFLFMNKKRAHSNHQYQDKWFGI